MDVPDRWGKPVEQEERLRTLRCRIHAVWLHAIFCDNEPEWLDGFIRKLLSDAETRPAGESLQRGLADEVAADWGDATRGRPRFNCWSYLSLHASLAPSVSYMYAPPFPADDSRRRALAKQSLGSAELLCSVPLRPRFFSIVRPWLSEVYGLFRNAEISMLLQNHKLETRKAELAGPFWAHEMMKLTDEGLSTVLREVAETNPVAVNNRRFVLNSIRMVGGLAYAFTGPIFAGSKDASKQTEVFLKPLIELHQKGWLLDALRHVGEQTYENIHSYGRGGRVIFTGAASDDWNPERLDDAGNRSCFFLVSEMIRNYCENAANNEFVGRWEASVTGGWLNVRLFGQTRAQRNPSTMTIARLNVFLRALKIGEAKVEWYKEQGMCEYIVAVNLSKSVAGPAEENGPVTSDLTDTPTKQPH